MEDGQALVTSTSNRPTSTEEAVSWGAVAAYGVVVLSLATACCETSESVWIGWGSFVLFAIVGILAAQKWPWLGTRWDAVIRAWVAAVLLAFVATLSFCEYGYYHSVAAVCRRPVCIAFWATCGASLLAWCGAVAMVKMCGHNTSGKELVDDSATL